MQRQYTSGQNESRRHNGYDSDGSFNSIYGSDVESATEYESDVPGGGRQISVEAPQTPASPRHVQPQSPMLMAKPLPAPLCVVCGILPQVSKQGKRYTTCGLTCAAQLEASGGSTSMCAVCGVRPSYSQGGKRYPTCGLTCAAQLKASSVPSTPSTSTVARSTRMCIVCGVRPSYSGKGGKQYPTCGLSCADKLRANNSPYPMSSPHPMSSPYPMNRPLPMSRPLPMNGPYPMISPYPMGNPGLPSHPRLMCVVCNKKPSNSVGRRQYPTCGLTCAEKLAFGGGPHNKCEYCHRKPKLQNFPHCSATCKQKARSACLICRSRPKNGRYHFCGRTCRDIAMKTSPLIVEARPDHVTFEMVATKFKNAWRANTPCPQIKKVYKIVESQTFLRPYNLYRTQHGNEVFRYHGTSRSCNLGDPGHTKLCNSSTCRACCILRTSYNVSLANPGGAFGQGIYTSSAASKSAGYSGNGIMFLNKVVLGKVHSVNAFAVVKSCPAGYDSVVFDRMNGALNETIVYRNDAIRPVFLIVFA